MRVAVVGASGYTGLELLRILRRHPDAELVAVTSEQRAGRPVGEVFPALRGLIDLRFEAVDPSALAERAEIAFTALPHAASASVVRDLRKQGVVVADLSADFRIRDPEVYAKWYGDHPAPELLDGAVYGIPELGREALRGTELIAVPGCYPTSVLLPLVPFLREGLLALDRTVFVDSKSGVSGAGRQLAEDYLFAEVDSSCRAYKVGGVHRHLPEIEQEASAAAGAPVRLTFVPYLLPTIRGIVTTVFAQPARSLSAHDARAVLEAAYADEPFVRVLPPGETPSIAAVRGSNFCDVAAFADASSGALILLSALDNLVKGASGQAVQCVNVNRGLRETAGLLEAPVYP
jgi:N-acetyl-gamma-glutamyl-phosphate reductase